MYTITPPLHIDTDIQLPASKSISNRALIIHALTDGGILPENLSDCDDTEVVLRALRDNPDVIDIQAAGTAMRFMTAYLSVSEGEHTLTGTERMKHRPISVLVDALRYLGAEIAYEGEEGYPPLHIRGRTLDGCQLEIPGDISSQYISALLLIAPALRDGLTMKLTGAIVSRPYIDLTLCIMREFGADADWSDINTVTVKPKPYQPKPYLIENDWSAASYWYEILALSSDPEATIRLRGLADGSKQGDSITRYIFSLLGVKTQFASREEGKPTVVTLRKQTCTLQRLDYDFSKCPDLTQTFVVTCCLMGIPFRFTGLSTLRIKETDRLKALQAELLKLGYVLREEEGYVLAWDGQKTEASHDPIETYEDHRMAMAFAPAALRKPGLKINRPEVVSKSYPQYWDHLRQAGFAIEESAEDRS